MKVSATVLVSLVSWVVAYPALVDSGGLENIWGGAKEEGQDKSQGLIENFKLLKDKFTPPRLLESAKFGKLGIPDPSRQQSNENDGVSTPPIFKSLIGKDNVIVSTISNVVEAAKGLVERIKGNFQQEAELPFLAHRGDKLTGVVPGLDKSDSAQLKGYESSGNDDSRIPIGIERNAVIEGRANSYRESAEGGATEVAGEKRAIHSAGSRASSEADGKTGASRGKQSAASQVSAEEIEEKSAGAKRQSHSSVEIEKKSLNSGERERVPEDRGILSEKQLPARGATDDRAEE
ncbi:uncharacterized protein LOC122537856 isoform X2 [Frieseomelitta varia]|uniref:uncharacterized protein LOC122537856 isoform X2 n=1 Tax=Frieseomelitta varia TaxID=561572 RepID=UPI001CB67FC6|nr:uncharacterized protein LOC122537856 isoform X2 [Frieseomelitta varia]